VKDFSQSQKKPSSISTLVATDLKPSRNVINSLNQKLGEKRKPIEMLQSWDMEGKGHVNSDNLKRVLNDNGYNLKDKDI
jgi:hypothetical protein